MRRCFGGVPLRFEPGVVSRGRIDRCYQAKFAAIVAEAEASPSFKGLQLNSFLVLPVQRVPRYKLLLENLLKYTPEDAPEYADVQAALNLVAEAAIHNNEMIRMCVGSC